MLDFIHRFIPPEKGSPWTLLLLHGTGGDENDLLSLGAELAPGAALLSPRGKSLENGMNRFFRRLSMGVLDVEDLKFRTGELVNFVESAAKEYGRDPSKVIAVGYSNGANVAASMLLLRPGVLAGAVLLRPMVPSVPEELPALQDRPIWIGGGKRDTVIPPSQTAELSRLLQLTGAKVEEHWSPGGHELSAGELQAAKQWLASVI